MSAVVNAVKNTVKSVTKVVKKTVESVGKILDDTIDVIKDVGSWLDDYVIQPMLDDPLTTIASIAAVATGQAYLLPYINAAGTVAKGGDLGDVALSFAASYAGGKAGAYIGQQTSQALSTVVTDAAGVVTYVPTTTSNLVSSTAAGATRGAVTAGISGGDIEQGLLTGAASGLAGGAGKEAGSYVFDTTDSKLAADLAAGVTRGATYAALTDKDIGVAAIMGGADAALNTAVNFGSEYLFGDRKEQEDWEKAATQTIGGAVKKAGMQEVYENVADTGQQRQPSRMASAPTATTTPTTESLDIQKTQRPVDIQYKRYVNDAGNVIYVQFRGDEPQQPIPAGYREEGQNTSPTQQTKTMLASAQQTSMPGQTTMPGVDIKPAEPLGVTPLSITPLKVKDGGLISNTTKKPTTRKGLAAKKK